ncbi:iron-siderophore ABC transporter substrate-binding protein [Actinoalloteichus hymeniacidonis]|uniref:ABC-type Fe3+-hydroxamate transport system, periplasmic component n=1 Tax=Actinoalloteichus hymeniacidonis TaxID=340345 RepID=A0AAC9MZ05_9PSEU|nr:iron-siderophore ABC transporter substrate-binding protein [Actinoalloteichus hymeniacidonis]AOS63557.1 ABC-type Fe3+-hydroxamate transport system, periplasmic component [Actinoalloteichus hymeniacidonis]MBB5908397.1 iron complex transport system substrate-binding protein [Actinoalloteichus hymeniacidonis]
MNSALGRLRTTSVLIAAALVGLAGCGAGNDTGTDTTGGESEGAVTIQSALGDAEIPADPQRVVTLGQGSAETAIALGRIPVGVESYEWGSDETGYLPWVHEAITEAGGELPTLFTGGEDIDFPAIVELAPDVILAPWSGITQEQFDILSDIAPTVAYPDLAWSTDWDEQIEIIGRALGMPDEAEELITTIDEQFAEAAASRPEYADVTFSYIYTNGPGTLGVFLPDEQRVAMVRNLGLTVDPIAESFPETEGTDSALIGLEQADQFGDSDLIFTFYSDPETREQIEAQPLYGSIPAVERDSLVASDENPFVTASSMINPLTVPWAIDRYLPLIDDAISRID